MNGIRIIGLPPGEVRQQVRAAWRRMVLPTVDGSDSHTSIGPISQTELRGRQGYAVDAQKAISALRYGRPELGGDEAATFWAGLGLDKPGLQFVIAKEVCEPVEISPVTNLFIATLYRLGKGVPLRLDDKLFQALEEEARPCSFLPVDFKMHPRDRGNVAITELLRHLQQTNCLIREGHSTSFWVSETVAGSYGAGIYSLLLPEEQQFAGNAADRIHMLHR